MPHLISNTQSRIRERLDRQSTDRARSKTRVRDETPKREPRTAAMIREERGQRILDAEAEKKSNRTIGQHRRRGSEVPPTPELPPEDTARALTPYELLTGETGEYGAAVRTGDRDFLYDRLATSGALIYETPADLMIAAREYFIWMGAHPLVEYKVTHTQGVIVPMAIPKLRMMTLTSLCLHLGISMNSYIKYRGFAEFDAVIGAIEATIHSQKIEGAGAGMLDSNIVSREMGLADKTDITSDGDGIAKIIRRVVDEKQAT